jgi:hypothetical protein
VCGAVLMIAVQIEYTIMRTYSCMRCLLCLPVFVSNEYVLLRRVLAEVLYSSVCTSKKRSMFSQLVSTSTVAYNPT